MDALSPQERDALKKMMYEEVLHRLHMKDALPSRRLFAIKRKRFLLGGAAAAVVLFLGLFLFLGKPGGEDAKLSSAGSGDEQVAVPAVQDPGSREIKVENLRRRIRREVLPDGSVVWLQPDTWIAFSAKFAGEKREVKMSGEAFFEVNRDVSRPFIVYSGDLMTRVLGTSFNIKAYKNSGSAEVSVFTGQVSVSLPEGGAESGKTNSGESELLLVKDEKAVFSQREKLLKKKIYSTDKEPELNIWKKNTISFDNTPVKEVVKALNREFGVSLRVAQSDPQLNEYLLRADFTDQNLPDILQMLEKSLGLTYEIAGKEIVLKRDK